MNLAGPARPLRELAPEVPEALSDLVMRAMALDPAKRPDARKFASGLSSES